jgi:hypothetical protein
VPDGGPSLADHLREHERVVVLLGPDAEIPSLLIDDLDRSDALYEVVRHPLLAVAELVRLELDARRSGSGAGTTLLVAEREIEDLGPMFGVVESRLPRVAARVQTGGHIVSVFEGLREEGRREEGRREEGRRVEARPTAPARHGPDAEPVRHAAPPARTPALRFVADDDDARPVPSSDPAGDDREAHDDEPPPPSGSAPTREELDMLLSMLDDPMPDREGGRG